MRNKGIDKSNSNNDDQENKINDDSNRSDKGNRKRLP